MDRVDEVAGIERVDLARPGGAPAGDRRRAHPALGGEHDGAAGGAGRIGPVSHGDAGDGGEVGRRAVGHDPRNLLLLARLVESA